MIVYAFFFFKFSLALFGAAESTVSVFPPPDFPSPLPERFVLDLSQAEDWTPKDERELLHSVKDSGYTCWFFPMSFSAAVCIMVSSVASYVRRPSYFV